MKTTMKFYLDNYCSFPNIFLQYVRQLTNSFHIFCKFSYYWIRSSVLQKQVRNEIFRMQILFDDFLRNWELQFNKVPSILRYITSYPEIASKFDELHPLSQDCLNESQLEWVSLVKKFDNPIEGTFFKEYWVPIRKASYDNFIDLSPEKLSVFETKYFFFDRIVGTSR
jgi:hypothetical protein